MRIAFLMAPEGVEQIALGEGQRRVARHGHAQHANRAVLAYQRQVEGRGGGQRVGEATGWPPVAEHPIGHAAFAVVQGERAGEVREQLPSMTGWDSPPSEPTVRVAVPTREDSSNGSDD